MTAKLRSDKPTDGSWQYARFTLLFAIVILFLGSIIWAGHWGLDQLRYPNRLPDHVHLLDDDLPAKLTYEFGQHPWVAKVEGVQVLPPKRVVVKLKHRVPVLAVKVGGDIRAVDGAGVVLPMNAPTLGLPIYDGDAKRPALAGKPWGDPNVEAAARKLRQ
jgi:hypothetical protein